MSTRKCKSTPQASKPRTPKKETAQQENSEPLNGVLIRVVPGEDGDRINIQTLGATKQTETPTLLRLGAKVAEGQLGLG